jgi:hypothetical protein
MQRAAAKSTINTSTEPIASPQPKIDINSESAEFTSGKGQPETPQALPSKGTGFSPYIKPKKSSGALAPEGIVPNIGLEPNLGGNLLYAGELDEPGRILTVAANIAGAATLAASAQSATLRNAQHEGVIDFLVNSLDEAVRILKNEIRKHQPVAVAVSIAPEVVIKEMFDRGLLPDLLPQLNPSSSSEFAAFVVQGAQPLATPPLEPGCKLYIWPIAVEFTRRPAEFDTLFLRHLPPGDHFNRRWLQLSPRYLGPAARRLRSVACDAETASGLMSAFGEPLFSS